VYARKKHKKGEREKGSKIVKEKVQITQNCEDILPQ